MTRTNNILRQHNFRKWLCYRKRGATKQWSVSSFFLSYCKTNLQNKKPTFIGFKNKKGAPEVDRFSIVKLPGYFPPAGMLVHPWLWVGPASHCCVLWLTSSALVPALPVTRSPDLTSLWFILWGNLWEISTIWSRGYHSPNVHSIH